MKFPGERVVRDNGVPAASVACVLLIAYYIGLPYKSTVAACVVASCFLYYTSNRILTIKRVGDGVEKSAARTIPFLLLALPLLIVGVQVARIVNGTQGVDFGIYEQLLFRFSTTGRLESSLLSTGWTQFLTHHFSPYLYLFGWAAKVSGNEAAVLLAAHLMALVVSMFGVYKILRKLGWEHVETLLALVAFTLLPARRIGLLWEVHDEIFALPCIIWAIYGFTTRRAVTMYLCLAAACFIKETMWLVLSVFSAMVFVRNVCEPNGKPSRAELSASIFLFVTGLAGFFLYTKILPGRLFQPSFNGFTRIGTVEQLFSAAVLKEKMWWFATLVVPLLPFAIGIFNSADWRLRVRTLCVMSLPALPFIAPILLSDFRGMYEPYNYYSIIPSSVFFIAALTACRSGSATRLAIVAACLLATSLGPRIKTLDEFRSALTFGNIAIPVLSFIPADAVVVTGEFDIPLFYQQKQVMRFFHANRSTPRFDFIVKRKTDPTGLSLYLRNWSLPCYEDEIWLVRCGMPSVRPGPRDQGR